MAVSVAGSWAARIARLAVVCLLVAALPLQALAQAGMALCGPAHAGHAAPRAGVDAGTPAAAAHDDHGHHGDQGPHSAHGDHRTHGAHNAHNAHNAHDAQGDPGDLRHLGAPDDGAGTPTCSHCAACFPAAAPPALPALTVRDAITGLFDRAGSTPAPTFLTTGPDRPPRAALA